LNRARARIQTAPALYCGAQRILSILYIYSPQKNAPQRNTIPTPQGTATSSNSNNSNTDNKPAYLNNAKKEQKIPIYIQKLQKGIGTWKT
jgi:hypothetical protein